MEIDLTNIEILDVKEKGLIEATCNNEIVNFNDLISQISISHKDNIDWHLSSASNRNTLTSDLFLKYCLFKYIQNHSLKNEIKTLVVDSHYFKKLLSQIIHEKFIKVKKNKDKYNNILVFLFSQISRRLLHYFAGFFSSLKFKKKIPKKITLIDTYVLPGFYCKDRYFNGILNFLDESELNKIFFVPTITYTPLRNKFNIIGNIYKVFIELRTCNRNFLIKEDYISFLNIFYAIFYCIRIKFLKINNTIQNKINYDSIIYEDLYNSKNYNLSIEGWLNFFFIKNISKKKLVINNFIDWWENQPVDKGYHLAINKFLPNVKSTGYLGYIPRKFEIHISPTACEEKMHTLPSKIAVMGESIIPLINKYNKGYNYITAPAFRYSYLWKFKYKNFSKIKIILVTLPIDYDDSFMIIRKIDKLTKDYPGVYNIILKPHPTMNKDIINRAIQSSLDNVIISYDSLEYNLDKIDILITSMSITSMEALVIGIPVIIIERKSVLNYNPIPQSVNQALWSINLCNQEIFENIKYLEKNMSKLNDDNLLNLKSNFFNQINKNDTSSFLNS